MSRQLRHLIRVASCLLHRLASRKVAHVKIVGDRFSSLQFRVLHLPRIHERCPCNHDLSRESERSDWDMATNEARRNDSVSCLKELGLL